VNTVPKQIYFILPEFLSFVDWCKKNQSSLKNKEIGVIRTLKEISEGVDPNKGSRDYARTSLINARKVCREEISKLLKEVAHGDMLKIYNETSNIEIDRNEKGEIESFSHIDCFMRIFFVTDQKKELKELFYFDKRKKCTRNVFSNESYTITKKFCDAIASAPRWEIVVNGYKKLLSIMRENKDFKDVITSNIVEIENIIEECKKRCHIKDVFFDMAMYVAGVSDPRWFKESREAWFSFQ
jgi:hypothetical protein